MAFYFSDSPSIFNVFFLVRLDHYMVLFLHRHEWRDAPERQRRVIERGSKGEGDNRPFVEKFSRPKVPIQQLALSTAAWVLGQCMCVEGGRSPMCQLVCVSHRKPQWTTEWVMTPTLLSQVLHLNISREPLDLDSFPPLCLSVTHQVTPLSLPGADFIPLLPRRGSHQFICCLCFGMIDYIWVDHLHEANELLLHCSSSVPSAVQPLVKLGQAVSLQWYMWSPMCC